MAKNISLMGAVFPDVPSILLPQQGGGLVQYDDTTDADATAADITQNKTAYVNGVKVVGTASGGGGGATNVVTGEFKTQSTTGVQTVNIPYTGNGYPVSALVFLKEGAYNTSGSVYTSMPRYAIPFVAYAKSVTTDVPDYRGTSKDSYQAVAVYRGSSASGRTAAQGTPYFASSSNPSASSINAVNMSDNKTLKVFVQNTTYGLAANADYTYVIGYST